MSSGSATNFTKSEIPISSITGVHKVTLKFNNHASSLLSVGFADAGTTAVKEVRLSDIYKIYTLKNMIVVDGLYNADVSIYAVDGLLMKKETSITGKAKFMVNKGVYLIIIDGKGVKVIVD